MTLDVSDNSHVMHIHAVNDLEILYIENVRFSWLLYTALLHSLSPYNAVTCTYKMYVWFGSQGGP